MARGLTAFFACAWALLSAQSVNTWPESTPEQQGVDSADLSRLLQYIREERNGIDSMVVIRHGQLILETYYHGYTRDQPHILNSVTKSFVSALTGVAIHDGFIASDRSKISEWFPGKPAIEVQHLLSMTSGIDWPQTASVSASRDMDQSPNWVQFILARPMAAAPGSKSNYSNGDAHLLAAILQRATGEDVLEFATKRLFQPLGIPKPRWDRDPQGVNIGSATIYMTPRDMVKLGQLYLKEGVWQGKQIVPAEWVRKSLERHTGIVISKGIADYGYFWWLYPKLRMFEAWGGAGQRIAVFRDLDLVVAMTANISDDTPVSSFSQEVYRRIVNAAKSPSSLPENRAAVAELQVARSAEPLPPRTRGP
jgi:CubicO group peptidase (beta-lactamase class C family)